MSTGRTTWRAKPCGWRDRERVVALGEEFGPAGPFVLDVLEELAKEQRKDGVVRTGLRTVARAAFLQRGREGVDHAREILTFAASIGALDGLTVSDDLDMTVTCRVSGFAEDQGRGYEAVKKSMQDRPGKPAGKADAPAPTEPVVAGDTVPACPENGDNDPSCPSFGDSVPVCPPTGQERTGEEKAAAAGARPDQHERDRSAQALGEFAVPWSEDQHMLGLVLAEGLSVRERRPSVRVDDASTLRVMQANDGADHLRVARLAAADLTSGRAQSEFFHVRLEMKYRDECSQPLTRRSRGGSVHRTANTEREERQEKDAAAWASFGGGAV